VAAAVLLLRFQLFDPVDSRAATIDRDANVALVYARDSQGNRVPDFSHCGYAGADEEIPNVPVRVVLAPGGGDDGARIQAALEHVASLPADAGGFRGAVLLRPGRYLVIVAAGRDRRPLIRIAGAAAAESSPAFDESIAIVDDYVPVGATRLRVASGAAFQPGDAVLVTRPSTAAWIRAIGADAFGVGWRPGSRDLRWERRIAAVDGDIVTLDGPLTMALEAQFGGGTVRRWQSVGRIERRGGHRPLASAQ
ncbi:MAG TPA: hypothetical protein PKC18_10550, partial [Lacipirellulaceae bacterium]|nr:hypothetical protein [Lacipirellulaceae bacterium]